MRRTMFVFLLLGVVACSTKDPIRCSTNADCIQGGILGTCRPSTASSESWCAFTDPNCPGTSLRWGVRAGDGLDAECVAGDAPQGTALVHVSVEGDGSGTVT